MHSGLWFSFHGVVSSKSTWTHVETRLAFWFRPKKEFQFWDNLIWRWDTCELNISAAPFIPQDSWSQSIALPWLLQCPSMALPRNPCSFVPLHLLANWSPIVTPLRGDIKIDWLCCIVDPVRAQPPNYLALFFCLLGLQIWGIFKFASLLPVGVEIKWSF